MSHEIIAEDVNQPYQLLVWMKYEYKEQLGCPQIETDFATKKEAFTAFNKVEKFLCKMVMKYESSDPAADGDVLEEEWTE